MKTLKPFGPTLGKSKLSKKIIKIINNEVNKLTLNNKNDYSSKLSSQIKHETKLSNSFVKKNLSIKNLIESEAKDDNLMAMREAVLRWGKTLFAENPPSTLKSLGDLLGNPSISQLFAQLDEQLYQHNGVPATTLDVALLLASLKKESNFSRESASKSKPGKALQSLYPD